MSAERGTPGTASKSLKGKTIGFCRGCVACQKTRRCVIPDDAIEIAEKVKNADVPLFATPIYYYSMYGTWAPSAPTVVKNALLAMYSELLKVAKAK